MPTFEGTYIEQELKKIDGNLPEPISLYLIGGGAMSFYDLKTAKKKMVNITKKRTNHDFLIEGKTYNYKLL